MNNSNGFPGKVVLVTGGTSGIGKATAIQFARAGAKVVLSGRRDKEGKEIVRQIEELGGDAAFVRADVAKDADVRAMVKFTVDKFEGLDIAFNNAGVPTGRTGSSEEIAAAVLYFASDAAKFTTSTSLVVDGGVVAG